MSARPSDPDRTPSSARSQAARGKALRSGVPVEMSSRSGSALGSRDLNAVGGGGLALTTVPPPLLAVSRPSSVSLR
ncbi:hypothetical protein KGD82_19235 [Nocardiopsis eucommiae]|uniref:Uncharacterized protein n=1 Tax=Nocardiopsis eucommiae TaxID=2831970 RepID=A0A975L868_9ACTN|nr:hypothetical protein KGD82_19235 [Nocardiopsis eucommiae]